MNFLLLFLQKGSAGIGGFPAVPQPDVPLVTVLLIAALNPAVIAVAVVLGRRLGLGNDQPAKLGIAAFAAALAGAVLVWGGAWFGVPGLAQAGRAAGGIFIASLFAGFAYAGLAYLRFRTSINNRST